MRKRILSLVLAAAVLLGLIPTALADSPRSQRESFMAIAEAQLGYREKGRNGTKYGTWYGLPGQPWCAMFISWCARYSGVPESVIPNFSGCFGGVKWFKQHGLWRTREYTPQAGDLLFIDGLEADGTRDGLAEHVAIVERASTTTIYTIEGNSINDMVERRERPRDESVLGYATPQYGSMSASAGTIRLTQVFTPRNELRGGSFKISGYVSSNKPLRWVYVDIRNPDGDWFSGVQRSPDSTSFNLYSLNGGLDFSQLGPGNYEVFIEAADSSGSYLQKRFDFKVAATDVDFDGRHADFAGGIRWVIDEGISNGTGGARFLPDGLCTRAQVVTFLWRAAGRPAPKSETSAFRDVSGSSYCAKAVRWAAEQGITTGTTKTTFEPDATVTRAQFVTFLWRYLGKTVPGIGDAFDDVREDDYFFDAVLWAYENGVTGGVGSDLFAPDSGATRAEVATFIYRAMNPGEKPVEPTEPVESTEPVEPVEPVEPTQSPEPEAA